MFIEKGNGYPYFNEMSKAALECYVIGHSIDDIERFILEEVLKGDDSKRDKRRRYRNEYLIPPNEKTAAENIIAAILEN